MPKRQHAGTLNKDGPTFSKRASARKNAEHKSLNLQYAPGSKTNESHGLRNLKQISYPELCSRPERKCQSYLLAHGVLSHDLPLCWSCGEQMQRERKASVDATVRCQTRNCYFHPYLKNPVEAYTPLHSQARQNEEVDCANFLRCCYLVGVRVPPDTMEHLLQGVGREKLTRWTQGIRLALATVEYVDSSSFEFGPGVLEFDTATAVVQRRPRAEDVAHARKVTKKVEKRAQKFLCARRSQVCKKPAKKAGGKTIFRGRHIVFCLRRADGVCVRKKYAVLPLPSKIAQEGRDMSVPLFHQHRHTSGMFFQITRVTYCFSLNGCS